MVHVLPVCMEFRDFLQRNGVSHLTSAPYHPASNGLVERAMQTVKIGLKKGSTGSIRSPIAQVLFAYQLTPQSTTGQSPCELILPVDTTIHYRSITV